ncbi:N-acetylmuramoyl-L-alanine amidase [Azorhizobium oxalatiphilum]|uniref:N-acetylmuramoyl-L-alanine amidase n=1 Tax=Azorhizobium oxalatiphilum TaxID=980631 RepID=UPI001FCEB0DC|nr:N-acetylmuramoyl-L-alanine amidase [Azorhizobium oxalatiphilum]
MSVVPRARRLAAALALLLIAVSPVGAAGPGHKPAPAEAAKTDTTKTDTAKSEPAKTEPAKPDAETPDVFGPLDDVVGSVSAKSAVATAEPGRDLDLAPVKDAAKAQPAGGPSTALAARIAGDGQRTRLIIDLSRAAEFRAFTLANPTRVIIDLKDVTFGFKADAPDMRRGLVSAYRFGLFAPGKARMVLDASDPVVIDKAFVIAAQDDQPARLVVDLVKTDAATFNATQAPAAEAAPPPPAADAAASPDDKRPVVVLDPGHGGVDSGTTGATSYAEKNIVLDVAVALRDKLEKSGRFRVVMTRSTDVFVPLGERVRIARRNQAALFVSIHADALAAGDGQARGASVYTLSDTASDADAAHLAEKENKSDAIAGIDSAEENSQVADILADLVQRETKSFSALFARTLVGTMKHTARMHRSPIKSAGFRVLKAHDVPSVLVELGYMSSPQDLKQMTSDAWRDKLAESMQTAINDFFATRVAGGVPTGGAAPAVPK